jgi:hypothetical protein
MVRSYAGGIGDANYSPIVTSTEDDFSDAKSRVRSQVNSDIARSVIGGWGQMDEWDAVRPSLVGRSLSRPFGPDYVPDGRLCTPTVRGLQAGYE